MKIGVLGTGVVGSTIASKLIVLGHEVMMGSRTADNALNTINSDLMVAPRNLPGSPTVFLSGNDSGAKKRVRDLLETFGWSDTIDLGDISTARATEGYVPLWISLWKRLETLTFNISVVR
jgi:8-hydroxy-5-deazaflavin:NADPH oxidoreductase